MIKHAFRLTLILKVNVLFFRVLSEFLKPICYQICFYLLSWFVFLYTEVISKIPILNLWPIQHIKVSYK